MTTPYASRRLWTGTAKIAQDPSVRLVLGPFGSAFPFEGNGNLANLSKPLFVYSFGSAFPFEGNGNIPPQRRSSVIPSPCAPVFRLKGMETYFFQPELGQWCPGLRCPFLFEGNGNLNGLRLLIPARSVCDPFSRLKGMETGLRSREPCICAVPCDALSRLKGMETQ